MKKCIVVSAIFGLLAGGVFAAEKAAQNDEVSVLELLRSSEAVIAVPGCQNQECKWGNLGIAYCDYKKGWRCFPDRDDNTLCTEGPCPTTTTTNNLIPGSN